MSAVLSTAWVTPTGTAASLPRGATASVWALSSISRCSGSVNRSP